MLALGAYLFALGCGGKVPDDAVGPDGGGQPAPACGAICAHIIGSCVPGASTADCVSDCEGTRAKSTAKCPALLDTYLRCMGMAHVLCMPGRIEILDCSDERNALDACFP